MKIFKGKSYFFYLTIIAACKDSCLFQKFGIDIDSRHV